MNTYTVGNYTIITQALKKAGITMPKAKAAKTLPNPGATNEDLYRALANSTMDDPYADPAVHTIVAKLTMQSLGGTQAGYADVQRANEYENLLNNEGDLNEQIHTKFEQHAATLEEVAPTIKHLRDLKEATLTGSTDAYAVAISTALREIHQLDIIITAKKRLNTALGRTRYGNSHGASFMYHNATPAQWAQIVNNKDDSIWGIARTGVHLDLAHTDTEVADRFNTMRARRQHALEEPARINKATNGKRLADSYNNALAQSMTRNN